MVYTRINKIIGGITANILGHFFEGGAFLVLIISFYFHRIVFLDKSNLQLNLISIHWNNGSDDQIN